MFIKSYSIFNQLVISNDQALAIILKTLNEDMHPLVGGLMKSIITSLMSCDIEKFISYILNPMVDELTIVDIVLSNIQNMFSVDFLVQLLSMKDSKFLFEYIKESQIIQRLVLILQSPLTLYPIQAKKNAMIALQEYFSYASEFSHQNLSNKIFELIFNSYNLHNILQITKSSEPVSFEYGLRLLCHIFNPRNQASDSISDITQSPITDASNKMDQKFAYYHSLLASEENMMKVYIEEMIARIKKWHVEKEINETKLTIIRQIISEFFYSFSLYHQPALFDTNILAYIFESFIRDYNHSISVNSLKNLILNLCNYVHLEQEKNKLLLIENIKSSSVLQDIYKLWTESNNSSAKRISKVYMAEVLSAFISLNALGDVDISSNITFKKFFDQEVSVYQNNIASDLSGFTIKLPTFTNDSKLDFEFGGNMFNFELIEGNENYEDEFVNIVDSSKQSEMFQEDNGTALNNFISLNFVDVTLTKVWEMYENGEMVVDSDTDEEDENLDDTYNFPTLAKNIKEDGLDNLKEESNEEEISKSNPNIEIERFSDDAGGNKSPNISSKNIVEKNENDYPIEDNMKENLDNKKNSEVQKDSQIPLLDSTFQITESIGNLEIKKNESENKQSDNYTHSKSN
ncbi:MAG: hypothetical protein MHPSP_002203 [Paramarteilia canceri]